MFFYVKGESKSKAPVPVVDRLPMTKRAECDCIEYKEKKRKKRNN